MHLFDDPYLKPYEQALRARAEMARNRAEEFSLRSPSLAKWADYHDRFGLFFKKGKGGGKWIFREWAPNATAIYLVGDFNGWNKDPKFQAQRIYGTDIWECTLSGGSIKHLDKYHLLVEWQGGFGERIPSCARYVLQDPNTNLFSAVVWNPPRAYRWRHRSPKSVDKSFLKIYEAHVGMAGEAPNVHTYAEFRDEILPRIKEAGYNAVQLMGVMEHPYYASFGDHVSSFFAPSSRFGTPDDLKSLVDKAHGMGLKVIMDIVHSHAVANERDGLSRFDGTLWQYFHSGDKGWHQAWGSRCFDYAKREVVHFLLSNCKFWLEEYGFDGYRFDGVTSMLFRDHGLGRVFSSYAEYFDESLEDDAWAYLYMANRVIRETNQAAITIAEDVSGLPGVAAPESDCGIGFDYRMAMGVPDFWFRLASKVPDESWSMGAIYHALTDRRAEENVVSYVESHDQALVGGKTFLFQLADQEIYNGMRRDQQNLIIERALALHKMARLATCALNGGAYLNFMGNEFGHPEWIDFPRDGNGWDYSHARRQWSLRDDPELRFSGLADFDKVMLNELSSGKFAHCAHIRNFEPVLLECREHDKVLAFMRGSFVFVFNFHHSSSYVCYGVQVPPGASCRRLFDTDEVRFCGQGRIEDSGALHSIRVFDESRDEYVWQVRLYLPARTAIVLKIDER